ncbi:MAG TPA: hypothetical protein VFG72_02755 [Marmoricola sp.]|nr:hypothetical protein [Marmoricola sp.]
MRTRAAAATLLLLVSSCGGSDARPDDGPSSAGTSTPAADPAVGTYDFTSVITRSTIEQNEAGPESKETNVIYVSCWDDDCDTLAQRAAADMWHAQTFRLVPDGDTYTSTRTRTGPCGGDSDETFEEVFTLEWTLGDDGTLSGRAVQEFTGCGGGETERAVYEVSGKKRASGELPYLVEPVVGDVIAALNAYDEAFTTVSAEFAECLELSAEEAAACKAEIYRPWSTAMDTLGDALDLVTPAATGACRAALEGAELGATSQRVRAAAARLAKVDDKRSAAAAERVDRTARGQATALQAQLVQVATMCVPPADYASLGEDGAMLIDSASSLIPPLDG